MRPSKRIEEKCNVFPGDSSDLTRDSSKLTSHEASTKNGHRLTILDQVLTFFWLYKIRGFIWDMS